MFLAPAIKPNRTDNDWLGRVYHPMSTLTAQMSSFWIAIKPILRFSLKDVASYNTCFLPMVLFRFPRSSLSFRWQSCTQRQTISVASVLGNCALTVHHRGYIGCPATYYSLFIGRKHCFLRPSIGERCTLILLNGVVPRKIQRCLHPTNLHILCCQMNQCLPR